RPSFLTEWKDNFDSLMGKRYWEIIANNLSKRGWSWGCVSAVDSNGRTMPRNTTQTVERTYD
ncbi:MAG TPA: hypothetical protein VFU08_05230, partial [Candidatus Udaeobacter sp.]|nr:hypothetical protein [Candidatus Udaeobacter sp.]